MTGDNLKALCHEVVDAHLEQKKAYQTARRKIVGHIMGQTMRANPNLNPEMTKAVVERFVDDLIEIDV